MIVLVSRAVKEAVVILGVSAGARMRSPTPKDEPQPVKHCFAVSGRVAATPHGILNPESSSECRSVGFKRRSRPSRTLRKSFDAESEWGFGRRKLMRSP